MRQGAKGKVLLRGGAKLPAEVLEVVPGRSWSWRVGGIIVEHRVIPMPGGFRLEMPVKATGTLWKPGAIAYGGVVNLIAGRIVAVAEDEASTGT